MNKYEKKNMKHTRKKNEKKETPMMTKNHTIIQKTYGKIYNI